VLELKKLLKRNWGPRLAWDLFMVLVATVNLLLILFDFTYLTLRPFYHSHLPVVTRLYDPVLGISPHPLTEELLGQTARLRVELTANRSAEEIRPRIESVRALTYRAIRENPFDRSKQEYTLEALEDAVWTETSGAFAPDERDPLNQAVDAFWSADPATLESRIDLFDNRIRPMMEKNYHRAVGPNGKLQDAFWLIDLPFLLFFWFEFGIRWIWAQREHRYPRWFFFPVYHWYDLIGLVPYTQFRIFRLLRAVSIYMRLRRHELSRVGQDTISRAVGRISSIIVEEISDAVAVRILAEMQEEIRSGTAKKIFDETIEKKRQDLEDMVISQAREIVNNESTQSRILTAFRLNLNAAVESSAALRSIPLPNAVVRRIVQATGNVVLDAMLRGLSSTLKSEEGEKAARELARDVLDQLIAGSLRGEVNRLSEEVGLEVIEKAKQAVLVKKWAKTD
jgi:hypothetical protein